MGENRKIPSGHHSHKCPKCKKVWIHSNEMGGNLKAHQCPKCGTECWLKHQWHPGE